MITKQIICFGEKKYAHPCGCGWTEKLNSSHYDEKTYFPCECGKYHSGSCFPHVFPVFCSLHGEMLADAFQMNPEGTQYLLADGREFDLDLDGLIS